MTYTTTDTTPYPEYLKPHLVYSEGWINNIPPMLTSYTFNSSTLTNTIKMNKVQQNKVAVFKIARNEDNEITSAEFLTEMWVETKNGSSVDFEVARDTYLSKYKASDLAIKTLETFTF